jgi:hypothetical protein
VGKEYDLLIMRQFQRGINSRAFDVKQSRSEEEDVASSRGGSSGAGGFVVFRATPLQQLIRAMIHALTFGVAYIIMLLGTSFPFLLVLVLQEANIADDGCWSNVLQRLYHYQYYHWSGHWEILVRLDGAEGAARRELLDGGGWD